MSGPRTRARWAWLSLLVVLPTTACLPGSQDEDEVTQAAKGFAVSLEDGGDDALAGVDLDRIYGSLADDERTVAVGAVKIDGDTATADLAWTWQIGTHQWSYGTDLELRREGETWKPRFDPSVIHTKLSKGQVLDADTLPASRGDILGAGGVKLVAEREVVAYGLDKTRIKGAQVAASARRLAEVLNRSGAGIDVDAYVSRAEAAGEKAYVEAVTLRAEQARQIADSYVEIPGATATEGTAPLARSKEFAAALLGTVGEATEEIVADSDGRVAVGDEVGLSGLQARYDDQLRGTDGLAVQVVDDTGETTLRKIPARDGKDVRLSLDAGMQTRAEKLLADQVPGAKNASALVAIRPSTGEVLAAANGPGSGGQDTATFGRYAPGSTFKVVTALALLRAGKTPETPVECAKSTVVDGKTFTNYDDYPASSLGRVGLGEAFAQSCNTAMITAGSDLDDDALGQAAQALGLGTDYDTGFPAYFGQVPPAASKTEAAADLIGQGKVLASPLSMAAVAASVQAGRAVVPRLVEKAGDEPGPMPEAEPKQPLTAAEARQLQGLMRSVVTDGSGSVLAGVRPEVGAKTGTAEYGTPDAAGDLPTHAWMIAGRKDLAVAVLVADGQSGSVTAGPILKDFLQAPR